MIMKWTRAWLQSLNLDHHIAATSPPCSEDIVIFWPELTRDILLETMLSIQAASTCVAWCGVSPQHSLFGLKSAFILPLTADSICSLLLNLSRS